MRRFLMLSFSLLLLPACSDAGGYVDNEEVGVIAEELNTSPPLIVTDEHTVCAMRDDIAGVQNQTIYCWGNTNRCQAGTCIGNPPPQPGSIATPNLMTDLYNDMTSFTSFSQGNCFVNGTSQGNRKIKCWGDNSYGQLGIDPVATGTTYHFLPQQIFGSLAVKVAAGRGSNHICALIAEAPVGSNRSVRCWGRNVNGQLGSGSVVPAQNHVPVVALIASTWIDVTTDKTTTCALKSNGEVRCWGQHHGNASPAGNQLAPMTVSGMGSGTGVTSLSCGDAHCCAVQSGALKCWGSNTAGELGNNSTVASAVPVSVVAPLNTGVSKVWAGYQTTCATKTNGDLYCWGRNDRGMVGDGTITLRLTPVLVPGMNGISNLTMGKDNVFGYKSGGYYGWGDNTEHQLYTLDQYGFTYSASPTLLTLTPP